MNSLQFLCVSAPLRDIFLAKAVKSRQDKLGLTNLGSATKKTTQSWKNIYFQNRRLSKDINV